MSSFRGYTASMDDYEWKNMIKNYTDIRQSMKLLLDRGISLHTIISHQHLEKSFICAVIQANDLVDEKVKNIISSFLNEEMSRFSLFLELFKVIDEHMPSEDGSNHKKNNINDKNKSIKNVVDLVDGEKIKPEDIKDKSNQKIIPKKRVKFSTDDDVEIEDRKESHIPIPSISSKNNFATKTIDNSSSALVPITIESEDSPQLKKRKLSKKDKLLNKEINVLINKVRNKIYAYISLIVEIEAKKIDFISPRFTKEELKETMSLMEEYMQEKITERRDKLSSLEMLTKLNCDNERLRFKIYEARSVSMKKTSTIVVKKETCDSNSTSNSNSNSNSVTESEGNINDKIEQKPPASSTELVPTIPATEEALAQKIDAIMAICNAAVVDPSVVDNPTLERLSTAATVLSIECEDHLTTAINRGQELCEAAADASMRVAEVAEKRRAQ